MSELKEHYGTGESERRGKRDRGGGRRAPVVQENFVEMRSLEPVRGDDGRYKFAAERAYGRALKMVLHNIEEIADEESRLQQLRSLRIVRRMRSGREDRLRR